MASLGADLVDVRNPLGSDSGGSPDGEFTTAEWQPQGGDRRATNPSELGERVMACVLMAPTALNWLVLAEATWVSTTQFVDSDGIAHTIARSRNKYESVSVEPSFCPVLRQSIIGTRLSHA